MPIHREPISLRNTEISHPTIRSSTAVPRFNNQGVSFNKSSNFSSQKMQSFNSNNHNVMDTDDENR